MALTVFPKLPNVDLDEVQMSFAQRLEPHGEGGPSINHAFLLELDHPPLMLDGLFDASRLFDHHELAGAHNLIVDVMEVTPTRTTLHVKPERALPYEEIAREVAAMVDRIGSRIFGGHLRPARLQWIVQPVGIRSMEETPLLA